MKEKLTKKLTNNLGLKLIAVVSAVLLWLLIMNTNDPETTFTISGIPIEFVNGSVLEENGLVYEVVGNKSVSVSVTTRTKDKDKIKAQDFKATANLADIYGLTSNVRISVDLVNNASLIRKWGQMDFGTTIETEKVVTRPFKIEVVEQGNVEDFLKLAAALERNSEHPLAAAVVAYAAGRGICELPPVSGFTAVVGEGVRGVVEGHEVFVGARMTVDGRDAGSFRFEDKPKPEAREALEQLAADFGVDAYMVTGDSRENALAVAEAVGIAPNRVADSFVMAGPQTEGKIRNRRLVKEYMDMRGKVLRDKVAADVSAVIGDGEVQVILPTDDKIVVLVDGEVLGWYNPDTGKIGKI